MLSFNIRLLARCSSETMYPASDSSHLTANVLRVTVLAYFKTVRSCAVNSCAGRPPGWLLDRIFGKRAWLYVEQGVAQGTYGSRPVSSSSSLALFPARTHLKGPS